MNSLQPIDSAPVAPRPSLASDRWAATFFDRMLRQDLGAAEFEQAVQERWSSGRFIEAAPETAAWLLALALHQGIDAGYAKDAPGLDFRSHWLIGQPGLPGAIHIQAPAEVLQGGSLATRNRAPHRHDTGRVSLITHGQATLFVERGDRLLVCPVRQGDLIFWPAWVAHTFDAGNGFWLVSAMASYVSPAADGFVLPVDALQRGDPEHLTRQSYADHLAELSGSSAAARRSMPPAT